MPRKSIVFDPARAGSIGPAVNLHTSPPAPTPYSLPVPASLSSYPLRVPVDGQIVQGCISERRVLADGRNEWRVQLPAPFVLRELWLDTQALHRLFEQAKRASSICAPVRSTPELVPVQGFVPLINQHTGWTCRHPLVGTVLTVHTSASFGASAMPPVVIGPAQKSKKQSKVLQNVTIEAAYAPSLEDQAAGAECQFWGRLHCDQSLSVIFPDLASVVAASHYNDVERHNKRKWKRKRVGFADGDAARPRDPDGPADCSFQNAAFMKSLDDLDASLPTDAPSFFKLGFHISNSKVPRPALNAYRKSLDTMNRLILGDPSNAKYWKLFQLHDPLILAPPTDSSTWTATICRRVALFLSGDWAPLLRDLACRNPGFRPPQPASDDPMDVQANIANRHVMRNGDIGAAAAALRAPLRAPAAAPGQITKTFRLLNPQVGDDVPVADSPSQRACQGGGDTAAHWEAQIREAQRRDVELVRGGLSRSTSQRRPLEPPPQLTTPPAIQFTVDQIIERVRRSSTSSAGGPSGTDYKTLRSWFAEHDEISENSTAVINLIAAGRIPDSVNQLFIAGRGVAIPKNDKGDLRPIVVGHVILRLIGSVAVRHLSADIQDYFLSPSAVQFGVGVSGGCELMASAINLHLQRFPEHIDISCDARNAFNSWCRSKLWKPLHKHFPSLYAFVKMVYGGASNILFFEDGVGDTTVPNSVGSRQGCSLGSFLYCLAIHPYLLRLRSEFPDLLIVAYCDDVHIIGPPDRAIEAYERWAYMYVNELQGELRDDKGVTYSPVVSEAHLRQLGLPASMPVTSSGVRILGAPVGTVEFCQTFATEVLSEITKDFDVLGRMPSLQAQLLVATKSVVHRVNHLLRNIPGGEVSLFGDIAASYDSSVLSVIHRVAGTPTLPISPGAFVNYPLAKVVWVYALGVAAPNSC